MTIIVVPTRSRLRTTYSIHEPAVARSDELVVLHHGLCHGREHFDSLIRALNEQGLRVVMVDQQTEAAGPFRNFIGLAAYREGLFAVVTLLEQQGYHIGSYVLHSMGARIGKDLPGSDPPLRQRTVLMAPIPPWGALPISWRLLTTRPLDFLRAVFTFNILSLADTPEHVRELFFDPDAPESLVQDTHAKLKHASFRLYLQLFWWGKILDPDRTRLLLYSLTDEVFHPTEYQSTFNENPKLKHCTVAGGHDFFLVNPDVTAAWIAEFHLQINGENPADARIAQESSPDQKPSHSPTTGGTGLLSGLLCLLFPLFFGRIIPRGSAGP